MEEFVGAARLSVRVGGLARPDLKKTLALAGVQLNTYAETLLDDAVFDGTEVETIVIVQCTVKELGLARGACLPDILAAARGHGLLPCPPIAGPYLRLAMQDQATAPDSVMSNGRAPAGALTIASEPLRVGEDYPRGFYLRVVDGQPWLRGYRCGDRQPWSPDDRFAFSAAATRSGSDRLQAEQSNPGPTTRPSVNFEGGHDSRPPATRAHRHVRARSAADVCAYYDSVGSSPASRMRPRPWRSSSA